jgi:hypothetical protein
MPRHAHARNLFRARAAISKVVALLDGNGRIYSADLHQTQVRRSPVAAYGDDKSNTHGSSSTRGGSGWHCSFCGKASRDVRKLIAGPTHNICDQCVMICAEYIR